MIQPVILAGGSGTRLWPLSRDNFPKPFLKITSDKSLLQDTILRLENLNCAPPIIVSNKNHKFLIKDHLNDINKSESPIILEPKSKNTAPALTLAAIHALSISKDNLLIVLPADHIVGNIPDFIDSINKGINKSKSGAIVTFGIQPTEPNTEYGYIECSEISVNGSALIEFIEKPEKKLATKMFDSGKYLWNSGIFMMRADIWMALISQHAPDIMIACELAMKNKSTEDIFIYPDEVSLATCPNISIDYAVMEKINQNDKTNFKSWVIPINSGWSDVGTWNEIWNHTDHDEHGNHVSGNIYLKNVTNSFLMSQSKNLAIIGLTDIAVIETPDATLITRLDQANELKELVSELEIQNPEIKKQHSKVKRPWGEYKILEDGLGFQVKKLTIKSQSSISLQSHSKRSEHWTVVKGTPLITNGDNKTLLNENESTYIPIGTKHRIENLTDEIIEIIEVQIGDYLGEDDIIRYKDQYNRKSDTE